MLLSNPLNDIIGNVVNDISGAGKITSPVFNLNLLTLNDIQGNIGQFTRAGVAWSPAWDGTLVQSALDQWRVNYGRYNGLGWKDTASTVPLTLTAHPAANVDINGSSFKKTSAAAWDTDVTSSESYTGQAYCSAVAQSLGKALMLGLNTDPLNNSNYTSIDYALYQDWNNSYLVYESGALKATVGGTAAIGDVLSIEYSGNMVIYKINGISVYTTVVTSGLTLFLDCALSSVNSGFNDIRFGISETNNSGTNQTVQLHPKRTINGAPTYLDIKAWVTGAFNAGDMVEKGGRYYQASANGADVAFNSSGLWVDKGIYNRGYKVLLEGGTTNSITAVNYRTAAMWTIFGAGTAVADQVGLDGAPNKAITLTDNDATFSTLFVTPTLTIPADTATHFRSCAIKKDPTATTAVMILGNLTGGTPQYPAFVLNPVDGAFSSMAGTVESFGDWWICSFGITNNGTNTQIAFQVQPTRKTYTGADDVTLTGSCVIDFPMIELNVPYASSFIEGGTNRQNELGNLKFPTTAGWKGKNAFPHAGGTLMTTWLSAFDSTVLSGAVRALLGTSTQAQLWLAAAASTQLASYDGTNLPTALLTNYAKNDAIQLFVRWGIDADPANLGSSRFQIIFRNASKGESLTYSVSKPYAGAFPDTGFLAFLGSVYDNNSGFRNAQVFDKPLTNNEIQRYVIP